MTRRTLTLVAASIVAAGCATAPARAPELPRTVLERPAAEPAAPRPLTLDPHAEAFVEKALQRSTDLATVGARWREAVALADAAGAARMPRVEVSAQSSARIERIKSAGESGPARQRVRTQQIGLNFQWELDLFGRLSSARQAADHEQAAAKADLDAARVTVANTLRAEITRLRAAAGAVRLAEGMLGDLRETVAIESSARAAGLRSETDLGQLRSTVAAREAELIALRTEASMLRFRLRTLSDLSLPEIDALKEAGGGCAIDVPLEEVPLRWLRQRRDVAAAELRLQAGAAAARSAHAALYPSIGLTGSLGRERDATSLLTSVVTQSMQRSLALGLVGTIFDAGQRSAEARAADERTAVAMAEFQRTLLQAAEEVDGAIARVQILGAAREAASMAASESGRGLVRVERRVAGGIDSRLALLQARRDLDERKLQMLGFERDHCVASLDLNRALGLRDATPTPAPEVSR